MSLLGPGEVAALCTALDVRPTKTLGQNFVIDPGTIRRIVRLSGVSAGEHVLEIGPGLGSLTLGLLEVGAAVSAVEIDGRLASALPVTIGANTADAEYPPCFRVIRRDAMELSGAGDICAPSADNLVAQILGDVNDADSADTAGAEALAQPPSILVANLPYNLAVPLTLRVCETLPSVRKLLVMVQDEVAERMAAAPGSRIYGVPSLKIAWYGRAVKVAQIGKKVFYPAPNVDSALVEISLYNGEEHFADRQANLRPLVWELIEAAFHMRRKTLRAALAKWAGSPGAAEELLRAADIDPKRRGETLDIADFIALAKVSGR